MNCPYRICTPAIIFYILKNYLALILFNLYNYLSDKRTDFSGQFGRARESLIPLADLPFLKLYMGSYSTYEEEIGLVSHIPVSRTRKTLIRAKSWLIKQYNSG